MTTEELLEVTRVRQLARNGGARAARLAAGVSLSKAAKAVGADASTVYRWETGQCRPTGQRELLYARVIEDLVHKREISQAPAPPESSLKPTPATSSTSLIAWRTTGGMTTRVVHGLLREGFHTWGEVAARLDHQSILRIPNWGEASTLRAVEILDSLGIEHRLARPSHCPRCGQELVTPVAVRLAQAADGLTERRLKVAIRESAWTQRIVSMLSCVHESQVSQIANGRVTPPRNSRMLLRLAAVLGVEDPGSLLDEVPVDD